MELSEKIKRTRCRKSFSNSQRQPISITVIYCCCYRFQWHRKRNIPQRYIAHSHANVSKAKLSNAEMKQVFLFGDLLLLLSCYCHCCYARFAVTYTHTRPTKMLILLQNNNNIGYVHAETLTLPFGIISRCCFETFDWVVGWLDGRLVGDVVCVFWFGIQFVVLAFQPI